MFQLFFFLSFFAACASALRVPPVPHAVAEVPEYVAKHGNALVKAFAEHRVGDASRMGPTEAHQAGSVDKMGAMLLGNIAEQPLAKQRDYLEGMRQRLQSSGVISRDD